MTNFGVYFLIPVWFWHAQVRIYERLKSETGIR